jgi:hypothetical protein
MIRVEATFSARRSNVVNSNTVGNAANSRVFWVNIATRSTIIESAMLKVKSRSSTNAGNGKTIIDRINKISRGPPEFAIVLISGCQADATLPPD